MFVPSIDCCEQQAIETSLHKLLLHRDDAFTHQALKIRGFLDIEAIREEHRLTCQHKRPGGGCAGPVIASPRHYRDEKAARPPAVRRNTRNNKPTARKAGLMWKAHTPGVHSTMTIESIFPETEALLKCRRRRSCKRVKVEKPTAAATRDHSARWYRSQQLLEITVNYTGHVPLYALHLWCFIYGDRRPAGCRLQNSKYSLM
ncbi:hypothetical protein EVAR_72779_1 [Eumeta japonica]|uniref:Uncharacterized protein n=1 Tax=Eumeta variegata TaxID=151549 RepID=A0A4C2ACN9_EUMVA|nr:hypothetical protein EVAR_72779_1 [Eumeta japonica]